ncbi:MAG: hypothetical protein WAN50_00355 [Minisyncoccia bacterium]
MNNIMAALFERMAAVWIERIAGSKVSTIAGILGIVGTFVGQLTTYIPTPYNTYVTLGGVILAGVAAILARDSANAPTPAPASTSGNSSTLKLGAWMLISLTLLGTMPIMGCTKTQVAQDIVNWTPTLIAAVNTVDTSASLLDPAAAPIFAAATVAFDAGANEVSTLAKAYLANPNATVLQQLQTAITTFQSTVNSALLSAAKITNPTSQQHAVTAINAVATIVTAMLGLVAQVSGKAAVAAMAAHTTTTLAMVAPYRNREQSIAIVAAHYNEPVMLASLQVDEATNQLTRAGF